MGSHRTCVWRGRFNVEQTSVQVDVKVATGLMADINFLTGIAVAAGQFRQLDGDTGDRDDHVIPADGALITQAEDIVQVEARIQFAIRSAAAGGGFGKADVLFRQKARQHRVGVIEC